MRKWIYLLVVLFMFGITDDVSAQYKKRKKSSSRAKSSQNDEKFSERLWYGGSVGLAFSGNVFNIGLTPMVGYKFVEPFSMGPRIKFDFYSEKIFSGGESFNYNATSWGFGVFSRIKFLEYGLIHMEYEYEIRGIPDTDQNGFLLIDPDDPNKILTTTENRNNYFIGGGYNSGGGLWGYEMLILYNVAEPSDSDRLPWDIRVGFTYNF